LGRIRRAKAGHLYERRRTRSGRFYTVQHSDIGIEGCSFVLLLLFGILLVPVTFGLSLLVPFLFWREGNKTNNAIGNSSVTNQSASIASEINRAQTRGDKDEVSRLQRLSESIARDRIGG
jgi:hypothetical protein